MFGSYKRLRQKLQSPALCYFFFNLFFSAHVQRLLFKIAVKTLPTTVSKEIRLELFGFFSSPFLNVSTITYLKQSDGKTFVSYSLLSDFVRNNVTIFLECLRNFP